MANIQLATIEDIAQRTNVSLSGGESAVFESSLDAATVMLATALQTELYRSSVVDSYHVRKAQGEYPVRLWTTRQFLRSETPVKVYYAYGKQVVRDSTSLLADSDVIVDPRRGTIDILKQIDTVNTFIDVTYESGFDTLDPLIPAWMKEAAISAATYIHRMQAVRHGKKFDTVKLDQELYRIMRQQVSTQLFSQYSGFTPHHSIEIE
jgi:hypothetical protein